MRLGQGLHGPLAVLVLMLSPGCDNPTTATKSEADPLQDSAAELELQGGGAAAGLDDEKGPTRPFDDAEVFFEFNTTDNDLGLQLFLDAEGWKRVKVFDPKRHEIVDFLAQGRLSRLGITELRFESAEPSPAEVLALFPAGEYRFRGRTVEGGLLVSRATLSHDFLRAPTFSPSNGEIVDPSNTVVTWNAPGAEKVELIIEHEELGHVLDVTVSGSTRRLRIPPQFLVKGEEYNIEILAISENGNRTIAESTFRTKR
jgi:hypothetical protein